MDGWTFPFVSFIIISRMLKNRGKGSMNETILLIEDNESIIMGLEYLLGCRHFHGSCLGKRVVGAVLGVGS